MKNMKLVQLNAATVNHTCSTELCSHFQNKFKREYFLLTTKQTIKLELPYAAKDRLNITNKI